MFIETRTTLSYTLWGEKLNKDEDYDMWLRLWRAGKKFYNVDKVLVHHRLHRTSAFNSKGN